MRTYLPFALGLVLGCTNDYDQFNVGGTTNQGAGPSGGAASGGAPNGGAPSGAGPAGGAPNGGAPNGGAPSGGMGGDGGTPPLGGFGGMGGMGGTPIVNGIDCGGGNICDVENGEFCCIPDGGGTTGTCKTNCNGNEATIECDEPEDCPGSNQFCCADLDSPTQTIACHTGFCDSGDAFLCGPPPQDECGPFDCMDAANLPDPIMTCQ